MVAEDLIPDQALTDPHLDQLRHLEIANPLGDLLALVPTSTNVGLFGPYGSGKSSILALIRQRLHSTQPGITCVKYDAWKYGGAALQRNFISHLATELGCPADDPKNREFHRGLYQKIQTVDFDLGLQLQLAATGWLGFLSPCFSARRWPPWSSP